MFWDLADTVGKSGQSQFLLHSQVGGDQHIHSPEYSFSDAGGVLYGAIVDSQGHFELVTG